MFFNGNLKALFDDQEDGQSSTISVYKAGKIQSWWITGMTEGETPSVGFTTDLADYYLQEPAKTYKDIHEDLTSKTRIMTIVLKVLKEYHESDSLPSFHYNNMLEELQNVAPDITEETLLQHGEFIVQQVHYSFWSTSFCHAILIEALFSIY